MKIEVAGVIVEITSPDDSISLPAPYRSFLTEKTDPSDFVFECQKGIPDELAQSQVVFQANHSLKPNDTSNFWQIRKQGEDTVFAFGDAFTKKFPVLVAKNKLDSKVWNLYMEDDNPFPTPSGDILLFHLLSSLNMVAMHSSAIAYNGKGYLFTGFSGVGKSTMANLWLRKGATVINDDRIYIRKGEAAYTLHNSPMHYVDHPKSAPLSGIFLLKQAPENGYRRLTGVEAISRVSAHCIQHDYDKSFVKRFLDNVTDIATNTPVFELEVYPDKKILKLIEEIC